MKMAPTKDKAVAATAAVAAAARPQEAVHKCPRCDSANTKFCYYNNYSLTQPRHFCKTCRRYWTKGGALRNVPVGGGCRKNKRGRASSSSSATSSKEGSLSATDIGGLKFFQNFTPAMDYNLAGLNNSPKPGGGLFGATTQISSFMDVSSSSGSGLNFPLPQLMNKQMGPPPPLPPQIPSLASSIESLSYINQDLHWKLQQQRLTLLFGGGATTTAAMDQNQQNPIAPSSQPLMFHNLEISAHDPKPDDQQIPIEDENFLSARNGSSLSTEWFFDSGYPPVNPNPTATSNSNINWSGMPGWSPYSGI